MTRGEDGPSCNALVARLKVPATRANALAQLQTHEAPALAKRLREILAVAADMDANDPLLVDMIELLACAIPCALRDTISERMPQLVSVAGRVSRRTFDAVVKMVEAIVAKPVYHNDLVACHGFASLFDALLLRTNSGDKVAQVLELLQTICHNDNNPQGCSRIVQGELGDAISAMLDAVEVGQADAAALLNLVADLVASRNTAEPVARFATRIVGRVVGVAQRMFADDAAGALVPGQMACAVSRVLYAVLARSSDDSICALSSMTVKTLARVCQRCVTCYNGQSDGEEDEVDEVEISRMREAIGYPLRAMITLATCSGGSSRMLASRDVEDVVAAVIGCCRADDNSLKETVSNVLKCALSSSDDAARAVATSRLFGAVVSIVGSSSDSDSRIVEQLADSLVRMMQVAPENAGVLLSNGAAVQCILSLLDNSEDMDADARAALLLVLAHAQAALPMAPSSALANAQALSSVVESLVALPLKTKRVRDPAFDKVFDLAVAISGACRADSSSLLIVSENARQLKRLAESVQSDRRARAGFVDWLQGVIAAPTIAPASPEERVPPRDTEPAGAASAQRLATSSGAAGDASSSPDVGGLLEDVARQTSALVAATNAFASSVNRAIQALGASLGRSRSAAPRPNNGSGSNDGADDTASPAKRHHP